MKQYQVTAKSLFLKSGRVQLTPEQLKHRAHNLKDLGGGVFEIVREICFKRGEKIGYDGELKALADTLKTPAEIEAEEKARADAEAETAKAAAAKASKGGKGSKKAEDKKAEAGGSAAGAGAGADDTVAGGNDTVTGGADPLRIE